MPHSVAHLNRLGVDPPGKPLHGISYHDGRSAASARRSDPVLGVECSRTALHGALLDAVAAAGVKVVQGDVGEVSSGCDVGARAAAFAPATSPLQTGCTRRSAPRSGWLCQQIAGAGGEFAATCRSRPGARTSRCTGPTAHEAYVTPVSDDCVGITILTSRRGGFDRHLESIPDACRSRRRPAAQPRPRRGPAAAEGAQPGCRAGVVGR